MSIKRTGRYNDDVPAMEAEIERLTAENERLRAALTDAARLLNLDQLRGLSGTSIYVLRDIGILVDQQNAPAEEFMVCCAKDYPRCLTNIGAAGFSVKESECECHVARKQAVNSEESK